MIRIRLARAGAKKRPHYHIVVANARAPRDGRCIERLGYLKPLASSDDDQRLHIKEDRLQHWLKQGAQPSERVIRTLAHLDYIKAPVRREQTKKNLPKAKAQERQKLEAEKAEAQQKAQQEKQSEQQPEQSSDETTAAT